MTYYCYKSDRFDCYLIYSLSFTCRFLYCVFYYLMLWLLCLSDILLFVIVWYSNKFKDIHYFKLYGIFFFIVFLLISFNLIDFVSTEFVYIIIFVFALV